MREAAPRVKPGLHLKPELHHTTYEVAYYTLLSC